MQLIVANANISNSVITSSSLSFNGLTIANTNNTSIGPSVVASGPLSNGLLFTEYAQQGIGWYGDGNINHIFDSNYYANNIGYTTYFDFRSLNNSSDTLDGVQISTSYMWTGYLLPRTTGQWSFNLSTDASYAYNLIGIFLGANAGLGIANSTNQYLQSANALYSNLNINSSAGPNIATANLVAGQYYGIRIIMNCEFSGSGFTFSYAPPGSSTFTSDFSNFAFSDTTTIRVGTGTYGTVNVNSNTFNTGNTSIITPYGISVPSLTLSGVTWNGIGFPGASVPLGAIVNTQIFTDSTTTQTWINPLNDTNNFIRPFLSGNETVFVMMWGGGGGGNNSTNNSGGGGGGYEQGMFLLSNSSIATSASVTVGSGGTAGANGSNSSFGTLLAYGGGGAGSTGLGGGGGGTFNNGGGTAGGPLGGASGTAGGISTFGGGGGGGTSGGVAGSGGTSIFGGAGGAAMTGAAGNSVFGGGGGMGTTTAGVGISIFGGYGANGTTGSSTPGGGGCGITNQPGSRGEVRVYVIK